MPNRFKDFKLGNRDSMWIEFGYSFINCAGRLHYKFNCYLEPIICVSDKILYIMKFDTSKYAISYFTVISDKSGKFIKCINLGNQTHPHKDPKTGYLCIGVFDGAPLKTDTIKNIVIHCLLKYNELHCYHVPNITEAKIQYKLTGGSKCQIS